uniref:Uncharacterized protein n=1 Tax=Anguilla anguilla TaxID=7936 RepID=A0A0E9X358_ANGAN
MVLSSGYKAIIISAVALSRPLWQDHILTCPLAVKRNAILPVCWLSATHTHKHTLTHTRDCKLSLFKPILFFIYIFPG